MKRRGSRKTSIKLPVKETPEIKPDKKMQQSKMKKMMLTLIDKADFLVDEDLNILMKSLPNKEQLLIKVDSILNSLKVQRSDDLGNIVEKLSEVEETDNGKELDSSSDVVSFSTAKKRSEVKLFLQSIMIKIM